MTALEGEACQAQRFVVVVFDGASLGIMSFAFSVFDMALHYGVLPDLDVRVVSGNYAAHLEPDVLADDIRAFYAGRR
jgi:hypothetical protein